MDEKKTGGQAFPGTETIAPQQEPGGYLTDEKNIYHPGMTLRDYFAAKAMQAIISNEALMQRQFGLISGPAIKYELAELAYFQADAMLEARKK